MEPHADYHWSPTGEGPRTRDGFRRAVRYESRLIAGLRRDLARLRRRPAIVAVFGDHGEEFGEHGGAVHGSSVHAELGRVTFLLSAPGLGATLHRAPVSLAALPATVLDLLGLPAPVDFTEPSLLPCLDGERPCPEPVVTELVHPYRSVTGYTTSRWRLVRDAAHDVDQLFDVVRDPVEQRDVAASRPRELASVRALAASWDARHPP